MGIFYLSFVPLKRPKIVVFGVQKHRFWYAKDDVLSSKSYAFTTQNLCPYIFNTDF